MKRMTFRELEEAFGKHNMRTDIDPYDEPLRGVIVYKQENWMSKEYSELSRSYEVVSNNWGWDWSKMGHRRSGYCLDGTDPGVRLDWYDWEAEYAVLLDANETAEDFAETIK